MGTGRRGRGVLSGSYGNTGHPTVAAFLPWRGSEAGTP